MCFVKILFHLLEVAVGIDFMREKNLFLTCFTHCKVVLWKICELDLLFESLVNRRVGGVLPMGRLTARPSNAGWKIPRHKQCMKSAVTVLKKRLFNSPWQPL